MSGQSGPPEGEQNREPSLSVIERAVSSHRKLPATQRDTEALFKLSAIQEALNRSLADAAEREKKAKLQEKLLQFQADLGSAVTFSEGCRLIRYGDLTKHSGDNMETYKFILTTDALIYCKSAMKTTASVFSRLVHGKLVHHLTIPLATMIVRCLISCDLRPCRIM